MRTLLPPVSVKELLDAGMIIAPSTARGRYEDLEFEAALSSDGLFEWRGKIYPSASAAAAHAITGITGRRSSGRAYLSVNGWTVWSALTPDGTYQLLADIRRAYREANPEE